MPSVGDAPPIRIAIQFPGDANARAISPVLLVLIPSPAESKGVQWMLSNGLGEVARDYGWTVVVPAAPVAGERAATLIEQVSDVLPVEGGRPFLLGIGEGAERAREVAAAHPGLIAAVDAVESSFDEFALFATLESRRAVGAVLDDFHRAASEPDGVRYFGHFAPGAVFLGTDATERWSVAEFRAYAEPHFSQGRGWTYVSTERHIGLSDDARTAWFDERLANEKYGEVRGSGALIWRGDRWLITQYNLAFPVPNDLSGSLIEMIREQEEK